MYHFFSIQTASDIIGITEMIAAILLGILRPFVGLLGTFCLRGATAQEAQPVNTISPLRSIA